MTGRFHANNGLCFTRLPDGSVYVEQVAGADPLSSKTVLKGFVIPSGMWASVVAHVSARGESAASHQQALLWHQSMPPLADADDALEDTVVTEPRL
ncbi:MAG TPA: hypothetical protein VGK73_30310 [Polyangiaceae bacterium]